MSTETAVFYLTAKYIDSVEFLAYDRALAHTVIYSGILLSTSMRNPDPIQFVKVKPYN